ncbi:thioredoxin reductase (NADPH) [Nematocida homosporus]|uniref:thioredoxin reductase (NADPH) n=1 Tax=Nematocida homosporus TaxID=1912981 RepID=UPI00221EB638|nr:thioredoxin reductase (NADPH) [Nematocida homosporus]KAI5184527.1 thioredoxin reductase (NADPH) [Nematocida homosporus]
MSTPSIPESVVIIGSGPAAYSASLYLQDHKPLILAGNFTNTQKQYPGGQLTTTLGVDNYPGFLDKTGPELVALYQEHVKQAQVRTKNAWVCGIEQDKDRFFVHTKEEGTIMAKAVIIATGSVAKRLYVKGTNDHELWQKGISACATCDGWLFADEIVMVIGGGDTAMEEVLYLAGVAKEVILIHRSETFRARPDLFWEVSHLPNVTIRYWTVLEEAHGEASLTSVTVRNLQTQELEEIPVSGLFFAIGHTPSTEFVQEFPNLLDSNGYIITNPKTMETAVEGLFAAGDVQDFVYRQAVTAAYSGMIAGQSAQRWLEQMNPNPFN